MSTPSDRPTPRRDFLGKLTASAIVLAGGACAHPAAAAQTTVTPLPGPRQSGQPQAGTWDDSWFSSLTAKHKAVFDSPGIEDGAALSHATGYIGGMRDALGAGLNDVQTVIVIRHHAIPMAFNDAMWEKYALGKETQIKDGSDWATHNPYAGTAPARQGARARPAAAGSRPQANFKWLAENGHILLGCDRATRGYAGTLASETKGDSQAIYAELKANLVPGFILQPTGVYAALRAQEAGCAFMQSS